VVPLVQRKIPPPAVAGAAAESRQAGIDAVNDVKVKFSDLERSRGFTRLARPGDRVHPVDNGGEGGPRRAPAPRLCPVPRVQRNGDPPAAMIATSAVAYSTGSLSRTTIARRAAARPRPGVVQRQ